MSEVNKSFAVLFVQHAAHILCWASCELFSAISCQTNVLDSRAWRVLASCIALDPLNRRMPVSSTVGGILYWMWHADPCAHPIEHTVLLNGLGFWYDRISNGQKSVLFSIECGPFNRYIRYRDHEYKTKLMLPIQESTVRRSQCNAASGVSSTVLGVMPNCQQRQLGDGLF